MMEAPDISPRQAAILQTLYGYQQQSLFCDTVLVTRGGEVVMGHSCVLAAVSPTLYSQMVDLKPGLRSLNVAVSSATCQSLLRVIYTGECQFSAEETLDVLAACKEFGVLDSAVGDLIRSTVPSVSVQAVDSGGDDYEPAGTESGGEDEEESRSVDHNTAGETTLVIEIIPTDSPEVQVALRTKQQRTSTPTSPNPESHSSSEDVKPEVVDVPVPKTGKATSRKRYRMTRDLKKDKALFICRICKKVCHTRSNRTRHEKAEHDGQKPYNCDVCQRAFSKLADYRVHMKSHTGGKPFKCRFCDMAFPAQSKLEYHENIHAKRKPHQCATCKVSFRNPYNLLLHMKKHSEVVSFTCEYCGLEFDSRHRYFWHRQVHVRRKHQVASDDQHSAANVIEPRPYHCKFCEKCFHAPSDVSVHERIHTGNKPFSCVYCGESFAQRSSQKTHEDTHTRQRAHQCTKCEKSFSRPARLAEHMRSHTGDKPFICEYCGSGFATRGGLTNHERTIHTKQNLHTCETCGKFFSKPSLLKMHERRHTGERPYLCAFCGKGFTHSSFLMRHSRTHKMTDSGEHQQLKQNQQGDEEEPPDSSTDGNCAENVTADGPMAALAPAPLLCDSQLIMQQGSDPGL